MTKIALMGSSQIQHIALALQEEYDVVDLQEAISARKSLPGKFIAFLHGVIFSDCDIVYNVFCNNFASLELIAARILGKRTINHWIGTDVRLLLERRISKWLTQLSSTATFVCYKGLQDDLHGVGIEANILPIVPFGMSFDICTMPRDHAVLVYLPEGKEDEYGIDEIREAVRAFPNLPFFVVANRNIELFYGAKNVSMLGRLSLEQMESLYSKISILLRLHKSDGLSMMVLEALGKGKHVIWDHELQHTMPGSTSQEIICSISHILEDAPAIDYASHEFVKQEYSKCRFIELFKQMGGL